MTDQLALRLLDQVLQGGGTPSRLSVIGLSKNAGKTFTLNHIIRAAAERQIPLGLVSTGRDGEEQDAITELPKPRIWAPAGAWLATSRGALAAGTATVDVLHELRMMTPFGPVVVGRVVKEGEVLLIGPGNVKRIGEALGNLEGQGVQLSLVDGSFDRIAAASPAVTGRVVLAAGAAYSTSIVETLAQVRHVLDVFDLPPVLPALAEAMAQAAQSGPVSVVTLSGAVTAVPVASALGDPDLIVDAAMAYKEYGPFLVLNGALSDRLLAALLKKRARQVSLIMNDPTHVLVDRTLWRRWRRQGGQAYVRRPIELVAITTNPHSPVGQDYDANEFFDMVSEAAHRPVFDLQTGLASPVS